MAETGQSRIAAARMRAAAAKGAVGVGAVGAFVLFAALARASHASHQHLLTARTPALAPPSRLLDSLQNGLPNSLDSGQIAPAGGQPQVQSSTS
jgi:hypothetical protein